MSNTDLRPARILLVDAEDDAARAEKQRLERHGFSVTVADSGKSALHEIERMPDVDLVLTDIDLGAGMDGADTASRILEERSMPVVFLTNAKDRLSVARAETIRHFGYVLKSSGEFVILEAVRNAARLFGSWPATNTDTDAASPTSPETHNQTGALERQLRESEERYRTLVESSPDLIMELDPQGTITYLSPSCYAVSGYFPGEALGSAFIDFNHPEDRDIVREAMAQAEATSKQVETETRILHGDGTWHIHWARGVPWFHHDGTLRGFIVFVRDVTERKTTEEALRQSESRYRLLAEYSRDVIVAFDYRFRPIYISPSAHELYGYTLEDFADELVLSVIHPADRATVQERLRNRMAGERPSTPLVFRLYTKSGDLRWVEAAGSFLYDESGSLQRVVVNYHDVTRRVEAEAKLQAAVEQKESLMQELNHRVKNNLKMVSSLVHLKDGALGDQVDLSDIQHQIDAIRIVHQKLHERADVTHIDFREYVHDLLQTIFSFFTGRDVTIENEVEARIVPTRTAVPLGLIINETATNAIKHGFVEDTEARFTVSLRPEPSHQSTGSNKTERRYCLRIANSGRAFPEDIDPRSPETLGLQLISGLASQIRGSLELQRSPHPVFTIRFPMPEP